MPSVARSVHASAYAQPSLLWVKVAHHLHSHPLLLHHLRCCHCLSAAVVASHSPKSHVPDRVTVVTAAAAVVAAVVVAAGVVAVAAHPSFVAALPSCLVVVLVVLLGVAAVVVCLACRGL